MARQEVVAAVTARLAANWSTTPIVLPNDTQAQPPSDGSAFVSVQFPVADAQIIGMAAAGARPLRETGAIRLVVSVPRGDGLTTGLTYCEQLAALFRLQTFSGVVCFEAKPPIDNDSSDNGAYWVLSISIIYQFDYLA